MLLWRGPPDSTSLHPKLQRLASHRATQWTSIPIGQCAHEVPLWRVPPGQGLHASPGRRCATVQSAHTASCRLVQAETVYVCLTKRVNKQSECWMQSELWTDQEAGRRPAARAQLALALAPLSKARVKISA